MPHRLRAPTRDPWPPGAITPRTRLQRKDRAAGRRIGRRRKKETIHMSPVFAEIIGPDLLIVLAVVALLFGGSQIPKLARSLGAASKEFKRGVEEGAQDDPTDAKR
jgi:TatA/E family protein of Tat protein translocase